MPLSDQRVIISETLDDEPAQWLASQVPVVWQGPDDPAAWQAALAEATGLVVRTYTQVDTGLLAAAPRLKVVGRAGVGLDNIDLAAARKAGVQVVYTPDANTQAVVEYVWALIGDALRPRFYFDHYLSADRFHDIRKTHVGAQLDQLTLGIVGMGRIGRRVARVARAIGMTVLCNDLLDPEPLDLPADLDCRFVDKPELWAESDIVTIHVDGRPENRDMIDAVVLDQLKPTCLLINAARGMLIDNAALATWAGRVADRGGAAVLDVHEPEPPDERYPLFDQPNIRLLPHLASRTPAAMANMSWVVRDVLRVLRGDTPNDPAW
jgi:D-3-phosphoglycerate dehydrogenase